MFQLERIIFGSIPTRASFNQESDSPDYPTRFSLCFFPEQKTEVSKGVAQVGLAAEKPVIFGVLTTDNIEQAIERAGTKSGNKGSDAALSLLEMMDLMKKL